MWWSQGNLGEEAREAGKTWNKVKTGSQQDQKEEFHGCLMLQKEL
jgi:hypothetical protein